MSECRAGDPLALFCDVGGKGSKILFKQLHVRATLKAVDRKRSFNAKAKVRDEASRLDLSLALT